MTGGSVFVIVITVLDVGASACYARSRHWSDAFIWLAFALANVALVAKTEGWLR